MSKSPQAAMSRIHPHTVLLILTHKFWLETVDVGHVPGSSLGTLGGRFRPRCEGDRRSPHFIS